MPDLTGQHLGQYQILARIAKGSVATIYKAYQPKLDRYVAVKVLSPQVVDEEEFLERFSQEARAIAQLDHPNIVPVYDFDRLGDTVYLVMKYVEGGTVKELLTAGQPLDLGVTIELIAQVGSALAYAHKHNVVHRDVKPSNILVAEGPWALLTDFGLAKIIVGDKKLTRSGIGMGTPDYMSPEQAQGFPLDQRADLYSLGATMYEMVTGRVPFEAESSMAVIVKHMTEPPPPPRQYNPNLPPAVEQVILTVMEKDPDLRYQTAEDFLAALAQAARQPSGALSSAPARGVSGAFRQARPAAATPAPGELAAPAPRQASDRTPTPRSKPKIQAYEPREAVADKPRPSGAYTSPAAAERAARRPTPLGSPKMRRTILIAAAALGALFMSALALVLWGVAQSFWAQPGTPTVIGGATRPSSTPSLVSPTLVLTPTATPTPTPTLTPAPTHTPTPQLLFISPDTPIRVGLYVRAVRPEACLRANPSFDGGCFINVAGGSVLYVLGRRENQGVEWVLVSDWGTGRRGWDTQVNYAAYAVPAATPTP